MTGIIIAWSALIISLLSLIVNFYRIYRDKSKIIAWSKIIYHQNYETKDLKEEPVLHLYMINTGVRPIILTELCRENKHKYISCYPLNPNSDNKIVDLNLINIKQLEANLLAHKSHIKLEDSDVYEIIIRHSDYHQYMIEDSKGYDIVEKMFFRDILDRKFYIKNSKKFIKILAEYDRKI